MKLVIVESPFSADTEQGIEANLTYARAAKRDCLMRGESPIASHTSLTQPGVLDDSIPAERELGIAAGHAWIKVADLVVFYVDRGFSRGMSEGLKAAHAAGVPFEYRKLPGFKKGSVE